jgi:hypothetical protein
VADSLAALSACPLVLSTPSATRVPAPVRFLNFNTPAGWENYKRDLAAALASGTPTQEEIGRIASRYDFEVV